MIKLMKKIKQFSTLLAAVFMLIGAGLPVSSSAYEYPDSIYRYYWHASDYSIVRTFYGLLLAYKRVDTGHA